MSAPVDWALARRVAAAAAGSEPFSRSYHYDRVIRDFDEVTELAAELVATETGLRPPTPARARVIDRPEWVDVNVAAFQRLLVPLTDRLGEQLDGSFAAPIARRIAGAEVGLALGWMSKRVLGQYDLLVVDDDDHGDVVYYVGPNVVALERRWGFPPREFRLWLALHELTHRAQFTGVPWMRAHFVGLVTDLVGDVDPDPDRFVAGLRRLVSERRAGRDPLAEGGLSAVFATPAQRAHLERIGGMMSLLEGHGDVTMTRAGGDLVPSAERFHRVLSERRRDVGRRTRLLQRLIGLEAKLAQYEQGERFLADIEDAGGPRVVDHAWERPEHLPTMAEIREPRRWLERVVQPAAAAS